MSQSTSPLRDPVNQVRGVLILSAIGFFYPILAIPAFLFMIILSTSIPEDHPSRRRELMILGLSLTLCLTGIAKFIISDGMKGIVEAGYRATGKKALTSLREIRIAQDILRKKAYLDYDKDGIGESAHLSELMGLDKARGTIELPFAPLRNNFARLETVGDAQIGYRSGYYLMVCLPTADNGWTAHPSTLPDNEAAEANFRAYAWPAEPFKSTTTVYFINALEEISMFDNEDFQIVGLDKRPDCMSRESTELAWAAWRNKKPRSKPAGYDAEPTNGNTSPETP